MLWASFAGAQAAGESASDAEARRQFEAGRTAYDSGDYEAALTHFRAAYDQSQRPRLLYNIGQAADRLRRNQEALEAFRGYLSEVPDADNRISVENRVRMLEGIVAREAEAAGPTEVAPAEGPAEAPPPATEVTAPVEPVEPTDAPPPTQDEAARDTGTALPLAPLLVAGGGVVLIGVGAVFGAMAKGDEDDYASLPVTTRDEIDAADAALSDAESKATLANVMFGIGGAALVAGGVWLALSLGDDEATAFAPYLGPGMAGLSMHSHFGGGAP